MRAIARGGNAQYWGYGVLPGTVDLSKLLDEYEAGPRDPEHIFPYKYRSSIYQMSSSTVLESDTRITTYTAHEMLDDLQQISGLSEDLWYQQLWYGGGRRQLYLS